MPSEKFMEEIIEWYILKSYGWIIRKYGEYDRIIKYHYNYVQIKLKEKYVVKIYDFNSLVREKIGIIYNRSINKQLSCIKILTERNLGISHTIHDYKEEENIKWIVFDFVEGDVLSDIPENTTNLNAVKETVDIMRSVTIDNKILSHNDICPSNIVIQEGVAIFIDWEYGGFYSQEYELELYKQKRPESLKWFQYE